LALDRSPAPIAAWLLGAVLLGGWALWATFGVVTVYEISRTARLEVVELPHQVAAPLSGRIASASVAIGQEVVTDQVLVELDASADRLRLAEEEAKLAGLPPRIDAIRAELVSLGRARDEDLRATEAALDAARARVREVDAAARFARSNGDRRKRLSAEGAAAEVEALRASSEADRLAASEDAMAADLRRLEQEGRTRAHEAQARMENLQESVAFLEGEMATARAAAARIRQAIELHLVRAPVAGRVGEAAPLSPGAYVAEGTRLLSVVPPGELEIVGEFAPGSAIGRVRPGQRARMRLDGFPWAQYGSIGATVARVATEIRDGAVRVELTPARAGSPAGLMQHGLPGTVEVAVERAAPASLALRAAGLLLSGATRRTAADPVGTGR
jgi:membrane fusion protein (multidrug efflux system)